ncbi:MAG: thiamine pyrophosphate-binding protein [Verrucomicrobiota bacterium]|nr:thiamine pyrophosphate-binding protein [Verrucomicrobiota bacterium]
MKIKVSDYIVKFFEEQRLPVVFEMSGGMIAHILDSVSRQKAVRAISMHHEQGAAFAAEGFARISGIPGVAMATSGPGATNLLTGIGSCYFDSTPAVFITGQVNRHEQKGQREVRQLGFQETDIVTMALPIVKAAWRVQMPEKLPELLAKAWALCLAGRPGPVLLDVPMDVQRSEIDLPDLSGEAPSAESFGDRMFLERLFAALRTAKKPLILAGGGVRAGAATANFRAFARAVNVPVVWSLMGVDVLPFADPLRVGMIGSYGNRWANHALGHSDLLVVLGSRLDIRQTGSETDEFKRDRTIFHVDCDIGETNNRVTGCDVSVADLDSFLAHALEFSSDQPMPPRTEWIAQIKGWEAGWPDSKELQAGTGINPNTFMHQLSHASKSASAYVIDVGQHQMWAAQSLEMGEDQRFLTSGGMGSMGFALPAAIGAAIASAPRPVVVVAGDGGFQSNIQELQTVARNKLPVKIVILNNNCHGMVRQFQESYFEGRYQSTMWGYSAPDFEKVAAAYGIPSRSLEAPADVDAALNWLWQDPAQPALLQVAISPMANAYPKMAFGRPITEMEPFATPLGMEGT